MADQYWKYLGFQWRNEEGLEEWFVFCVLPFGLSTAPYVFTKVTCVLVRHWRSDGIRCQLYMDDGSGGAQNFEWGKAGWPKTLG